MYTIICYLLVGLILLGFLYLFWKVIKKVVVNSVVGLFLLFILNYGFGVAIPINLWTILVTAFFGLAGVGTLLLLCLAGLL